MFQEVRTVGSLSMQVGYYRGFDECKFSVWKEDPAVFAKAMPRITCEAGETQIARVLDHVSKETAQRQIHAVVFVGDCCEEERDTLVQRATHIAKLNVPIFMFQEGQDIYAKRCFQEIATITKGNYFGFDKDCLTKLADTLNTIARFAVGGVGSLSNEARRLIGR
jgi:hypothetical protein